MRLREKPKGRPVVVHADAHKSLQGTHLNASTSSLEQDKSIDSCKSRAFFLLWKPQFCVVASCHTKDDNVHYKHNDSIVVTGLDT